MGWLLGKRLGRLTSDIFRLIHVGGNSWAQNSFNRVSVVTVRNQISGTSRCCELKLCTIELKRIWERMKSMREWYLLLIIKDLLTSFFFSLHSAGCNSRFSPAESTPWKRIFNRKGRIVAFQGLTRGEGITKSSFCIITAYNRYVLVPLRSLAVALTPMRTNSSSLQSFVGFYSAFSITVECDVSEWVFIAVNDDFWRGSYWNLLHVGTNRLILWSAHILHRRW